MTHIDDVRRGLQSRPATRIGDPNLRRAAVAVILRDGGPGLDILFIRRAEHPNDPWSGQMGFPGGRAESGDADPLRTAIRETHEEVGLDLDVQGEFLGPLDEVRAMARLQPTNLVIDPFVFHWTGDAATALSDEVGSVHWLPLDDLLDGRHRSTMEYPVQGSSVQFPCLRYDGVVIWGLTLKMFSNLGELIRTV